MNWSRGFRTASIVVGFSLAGTGLIIASLAVIGIWTIPALVAVLFITIMVSEAT